MRRVPDVLDVWFDSGARHLLNGIIHLRIARSSIEVFLQTSFVKELTKLEAGFIPSMLSLRWSKVKKDKKCSC